MAERGGGEGRGGESWRRQEVGAAGEREREEEEEEGFGGLEVDAAQCRSIRHFF